jgi:hypothetical protein
MEFSEELYHMKESTWWGCLKPGEGASIERAFVLFRLARAAIDTLDRLEEPDPVYSVGDAIHLARLFQAEIHQAEALNQASAMHHDRLDLGI